MPALRLAFRELKRKKPLYHLDESTSNPKDSELILKAFVGQRVEVFVRLGTCRLGVLSGGMQL